MKPPNGLFTDDTKKTITALENVDDLSKYYRTLVSINLETLDTYYQMIKSHTDKSFRTATVVGIAGFVLIALGVILFYSDSLAHNVTVGAMSGISGVLIELISGIQFWIYTKTVKQISEYRDSILDSQLMLLAFQLANSLEDETNKVNLAGKFMDYLGRVLLPEKAPAGSVEGENGGGQPPESVD